MLLWAKPEKADPFWASLADSTRLSVLDVKQDGSYPFCKEQTGGTESAGLTWTWHLTGRSRPSQSLLMYLILFLLLLPVSLRQALQLWCPFRLTPARYSLQCLFSKAVVAGTAQNDQKDFSCLLMGEIFKHIWNLIQNCAIITWMKFGKVH